MRTSAWYARTPVDRAARAWRAHRQRTSACCRLAQFLNAARGDQSLFVSAAELVEAWRIFTPLLHAIDDKKPQPVFHPFGALPEGYVSWFTMASTLSEGTAPPARLVPPGARGARGALTPQSAA